MAYEAIRRGSNIGSEINDFFEQYAGRHQHVFYCPGSLADRACRGIDDKLAMERRLVVVADAGKGRQGSRSRLGVMPLRIAALADFGRCRDVDLAKSGVGDLAGGGAIFARGRYRRDDGDVSIACQMGGDFGKPSNILAAVARQEAEVAVEAGTQ